MFIIVKEEEVSKLEETKRARAVVESKLTLTELKSLTELPLHKIVGPIVAAGKQTELEEERQKHFTKQKAFITMTEFEEYQKNYDSR